MSEGAHADADRGATPAFVVDPLPAPSGVLALRLQGELDIATTPRIRAAVDGGLRDGVRALVLDMRGVAFMDSSMLRELLRARAELAARGAIVVLAGATAPVLRLLELTGTRDLLVVADSLEQALAEV